MGLRHRICPVETVPIWERGATEAVHAYVDSCSRDRPYQRLGNKLLKLQSTPASDGRAAVCDQRLGG